MGEIKSTLELAMERTRNLVPTREEREAMARREDETRVQAAVRRLLDGELAPEALADLVARQEAERPAFPWREALCRETARALVPGENHGPLLQALRALDCPRAVDLDQAVTEALARAEELDRETAERVRATLAAEGIRGTAVIPNQEADAFWQQERERLRDAFAARRDELLE